MLTKEGKAIKLDMIRKEANDIIEYAGRKSIYCANIDCYECPANIGKDEIVCFSNLKMVR